jgi:hypothetical protein
MEKNLKMYNKKWKKYGSGSLYLAENIQKVDFIKIFASIH